MAEEEANENGEGNGEQGGRGKQLLIVGAAVVLALVIGAAGAWWFMGGDQSPQSTDQADQEGGADSAKQAPGELHELSGFVVNLARSSRTRYLKTTIQLELADKKALKTAKERKAQIRDALIILLSNQSVEGLQNMQGKYELKRQIVARLNNLMGTGTVRNVYFTEFVIQ